MSTSDPPCRGVRGHGNATLKADPEKALLCDLIERYRGGTDPPPSRAASGRPDGRRCAFG